MANGHNMDIHPREHATVSRDALRVVRRDWAHSIAMTSGEAPVEIVPYDPSWPSRFDHEKVALRRTLARWLVGPIEHIGSTAVPGLAAKPVIDIMAGVLTLDGSRPAIGAAVQLGYCYAPYRPDSEHWFCKPSPAFRTHHLHLVPFGSPQWISRIAFRDYLRAHSAVAAEYEDLKRRLAQQFQFDREAYTEAKHPFITRITDVALKEGYGSSHLGKESPREQY